MGTRLSAHFRLEEFACPCCHVARAHPALAAGLEKLRALAYPTGLVVRSGYRCPARNKAVGGATASRHMRATAADVDLRATLDQVVKLGVFGGIGWQLAGGRQLVRHVDVRHLEGRDTSVRGLVHPTTWRY
jgi:uncharacterized protein YcbK (DUF882 family)